MPTRYKILFLGQGLIFTMAAWIRTKDVEKAQQIKILAEAESKRLEGNADNGSAESAESSQASR